MRASLRARCTSAQWRNWSPEWTLLPSVLFIHAGRSHNVVMSRRQKGTGASRRSTVGRTTADALRASHLLQQPDKPGELEFIVDPQVQRIFDHFCALHGIRIAFYSPSGDELRVGQSRPNCHYCRLLRQDLGYEQNCRQLDQSKRELAGHLERGAIVYQCHGGMTEAIMPLSSSGRLLGFVMIGQFRTRSSPPAEVLRRSRQKGTGSEPQAAGPVKNARQPGACPLLPRMTRNGHWAACVRSAFARTPQFSSQQARHVIAIFELLVGYIAARHMIKLKDVVGSILARLREHPEERLPLSRAAAMVGRSPTTLSHLFRRTLGRSYRQVRIGIVLNAADAFFRDKPGVRVAEVARRLGFDDPLYFSRLYRNHRGIPPSQAARALSRVGQCRSRR